MGNCDYWLKNEEMQWCNITDDPCSCEGFCERCRIGGQSLTSVMQIEENYTLKEAAHRAQKRRHSVEKAS